MSQAQTIIEILYSNTENFNQLRSEIIQNVHSFMKLFSTSSFQNSALEDQKTFFIVMKILALFFENFKFEEDSLDSIILPFTSTFLLSPLAKNVHSEVSKITCALFKILNKYNKFLYAINLFNNLNKSSDPNIFTNTMAYSVYYAYQYKNYNQVSELLNNFKIELMSSNYNDHIDYCMFQFYRGLIALSQRNFFRATIFFLCVLKVHFGGIFFNAFQLESVRRLILLSYLVDSNLRKAINNSLNGIKLLIYIKPIILYDEFNKLLNNKTSNYKDVSKFYKEHKGSFSQHKTKGLVKLCLKEYIYNKLTESLKTYKRIKIDKLCTILDIDRQDLILNLKQFTLRNKINIKINEVTNTIEVFEDDFNEKVAVNELKNIYSNLNEVQIEMVEFVFQKSYKIAKKIQKKLNSGEVLTGLISKDNEIMDEDD